MVPRVARTLAGVLLMIGVCRGLVKEDQVASLPGLDGALSSPLYSGYIRASAANQTFYTHYLLTEAQSDPSSAPLVLWQQGGPGSSGMGFGWLAELGPYTVNSRSLENSSSSDPPTVFRNPLSWDRAANVLIFEHPPGTGFSYCADHAEKPVPCNWNDQTQAEAFEATLAAWEAAWPEYASRELHMIGESYAGLLLPHLVDRLLTNQSTARAPKSLAIGNGCPGTSGASPEHPGTCNGPFGDYDTQHVFEIIAGHGGVSRALRDRVMAACGFPCAAPTWSEQCNKFDDNCTSLLAEVNQQNGPFNIYNYYDNCGDGNQLMSWRQHMSAGALPNPTKALPIRRTFSQPQHGGESYACGTGRAALAWANLAQVREALHMRPEAFYGRGWSLQAGAGMEYQTYTGSSFDLYPHILEHLPVTIYNGDVDACVPYNSNEDWTTALAKLQGYTQTEQWRPWVLQGESFASGYVSTYETAAGTNFSFVTIKDSGHMVPQYQPERAYTFFSRWLNAEPY